MNARLFFCTSLFVAAGAVSGSDYTWLAQPLNADWLGTANWNLWASRAEPF